MKLIYFLVGFAMAGLFVQNASALTLRCQEHGDYPRAFLVTLDLNQSGELKTLPIVQKESTGHDGRTGLVPQIVNQAAPAKCEWLDRSGYGGAALNVKSHCYGILVSPQTPPRRGTGQYRLDIIAKGIYSNGFIRPDPTPLNQNPPNLGN
ncbi:MAG: hypothetical protein ABL958_08050, partial [Bdellovibrionia bacterium]